MLGRRCRTQASRTKGSAMPWLRGDRGEFAVEHTGEGEQVVALVLQRDTHGANTRCILRLAARQFVDDEVKQHLPCGQVGSGKSQNVMAQPLGERSDIMGQPGRPRLDLPREIQLNGRLAVQTTMAHAADPVRQLLASRPGTLGEARQRVGEAFVLMLDVEHIAMAWRVGPGGLLPGTQALPRIGDRIRRLQPLPAGVEEMHAPGISVAMLRRDQKVAVSRRGTDAGQHGHRTLEDLIGQANWNA
jgi:hypothetical protein